MIFSETICERLKLDRANLPGKRVIGRTRIELLLEQVGLQKPRSILYRRASKHDYARLLLAHGTKRSLSVMI